MCTRPRARHALALLLLAPARLAGAQEPTTTTLAPAPAPETTEVSGAVPTDIVGRWFAVGEIKLPSGTSRPIPRTFEIRRAGERLEVVVDRHPIPEAVGKSIEAAGAAGKGWKPTPEDLRAVDENWGKSPAIDVSYAKVEHKLIGADAYEPEFKDDETTKDAKFAITTLEVFSGRTAAMRSYTVYGVKEQTGDTMSGKYLTSTIAAAPMPIPIVLKGDFVLYRLGGGGAAPRERSWFERLFSGCQRQ